MKRVVQIQEAKHSRRKPKRPRRGRTRQRPRREAEREVRRSTVASFRWLRKRGVSLPGISCILGISESTLKTWVQRWKENRLVAVAKGRPEEESTRQERNEVIAILGQMGPATGIPTLMDIFPDMSRSELERLLARYRLQYKSGKSVIVHALRWTRPGSVWAMDFATPPFPIDGVFPRLLVVRDLASGKQLLALPVMSEDAEAVVAALLCLFARYAPPVVIKCDNGSAFKSKEVRDLLESHEIMVLYSPPGTPSYNGSCEAGIGVIKTWTHHESARNDRPWYWSSNDVEAARRRANEQIRPEGPGSKVPDRVWRNGRRITDEEEADFRATYVLEFEREKKYRGVLPLLPVDEKTKESIDRIAISRALIKSGLLKVRRRKVSPHFFRKNRPAISRG